MAKEKGCIFRKDEEGFKKKMQELIETGASLPRRVSMSEWYYMQNHAQKCAFCAKKFEDLVQKTLAMYPEFDGPTTLL